MTREQQFEAILSTAQGIDAAIASIIITEPGIYPALPALSYATGFSWVVGDGPKVIHASTFNIALLRAGLIQMRLLSSVLGITTTRKDPKLKDVTPPLAEEGGDIHWSHIDNACGIRVRDVDMFTSGDYGIRVENDRVIPFNDVYLQVMKAADKSIAHLTHESEWSSPYLGGVVVVGTFLVVTTQEALLRHSWGDTFDEVVFRNSKRMLPEQHFGQYMTTLAEFRIGVKEMLS